jgi:hypothetical protein
VNPSVHWSSDGWIEALRGRIGQGRACGFLCEEICKTARHGDGKEVKQDGLLILLSFG